MIPFFPSLLPVDLRTDLQPVPQPHKIEYLKESLQHITNELKGVLGLLDSLNSHQSPLFASTPREGVPLPTYASLAGLQAGASLLPPAGVPLVDQWARSTGLSSSRSFAAGQSVDSMLAEKWHKYFPGRSPVHPSCLRVWISQPCRFQAAPPSHAAGGKGANEIRTENPVPGGAADG